jgi:hypothetical protein
VGNHRRITFFLELQLEKSFKSNCLGGSQLGIDQFDSARSAWYSCF